VEALGSHAVADTEIPVGDVEEDAVAYGYGIRGNYADFERDSAWKFVDPDPR